VQKSALLARAHDLELAGASPTHSATWMFTSGATMWMSHLYAQFGCVVFELIIQESDHPVEPSLGLIALTGTGCSAPSSRLVMICQVVPITELPLVKASISLV
jgi:hypothetical protein